MKEWKLTNDKSEFLGVKTFHSLLEVISNKIINFRFPNVVQTELFASPVLHCASLLGIIARVINARALKMDTYGYIFQSLCLIR